MVNDYLDKTDREFKIETNKDVIDLNYMYIDTNNNNNKMYLKSQGEFVKITYLNIIFEEDTKENQSKLIGYYQNENCPSIKGFLLERLCDIYIRLNGFQGKSIKFKHRIDSLFKDYKIIENSLESLEKYEQISVVPNNFYESFMDMYIFSKDERDIIMIALNFKRSKSYKTITKENLKSYNNIMKELNIKQFFAYYCINDNLETENNREENQREENKIENKIGKIQINLHLVKLEFLDFKIVVPAENILSFVEGKIESPEQSVIKFKNEIKKIIPSKNMPLSLNGILSRIIESYNKIKFNERQNSYLENFIKIISEIYANFNCFKGEKGKYPEFKDFLFYFLNDNDFIYEKNNEAMKDLYCLRSKRKAIMELEKMLDDGKINEIKINEIKNFKYLPQKIKDSLKKINKNNLSQTIVNVEEMKIECDKSQQEEIKNLYEDQFKLLENLINK